MSIQLNVQTVLILLALGHLFSVVLIAAYKHKQVKDSAVNMFYIAKWLQAGTWIMMSVPQIKEQMVLLTLANMSFLLGISLEARALLKVIGGFDTRARLFYRYFTTVAIVAYFAVVIFYNLEMLRISVVSFSVALLAVPPVRQMISCRQGSMLCRIIGYTYLFIALGLLCRTVISWFPIIPVSMFEPGLYQNASMLTLYLIMMLGNTGFVLLSKEQADRELLKLASYDDLTGVLNRRSFNIQAERLLGNREGRIPVSFILLDIDYFKQINDGYGHEAGDRALENIAMIVKENLPPPNLFGRLGGDEFAILLPESGIEESNIIAEQVRNAVELSGARQGPQATTISMGIVTVPPDKKIPLKKMYTASDQALYRAKHLGRNCVARIDIHSG